MAYSSSKTALKTVLPGLIVPISIGIDVVAKQFGIDIADGRSYEIAIGIYGFFQGVGNWLKHRRKK